MKRVEITMPACLFHLMQIQSDDSFFEADVDALEDIFNYGNIGRKRSKDDIIIKCTQDPKCVCISFPQKRELLDCDLRSLKK